MISLRGGGIIMTKFQSQQPTVDLDQVVQVVVDNEQIVANIDASISFILDKYKNSKAFYSQLMREFRKLFQIELEAQKIYTDSQKFGNYINSVKLWIEQLLPLIEYFIRSDGDLCLQLVDYISVLFKTLYIFCTTQNDEWISDDYYQSILDEVVNQKKHISKQLKINQSQKYIYQFIMIELQIFEEVLGICRKSEIKEQAISVLSEGFKSALKLEVTEELISSLKESFFLLAKESQNQLKKVKLDIILNVIRQTKIRILLQQREQIDLEQTKQNLIKLHKTVQESENWEIRFCWIKMIGELINYRDTNNDDFKKFQLQLLNGDGQSLNNFVSYSNSNFKTLQTRNSDDEPLLLSFINEFYRFDYKEQILRLINFFENTYQTVDEKMLKLYYSQQNTQQKQELPEHQTKLKELNKYFRLLQQQLQLVAEITTYINFCCLRAKMLQSLFAKSKIDRSEILFSQQLIFIDKILQNYRVTNTLDKNQTLEIKSFVGYILQTDIVTFADLIQQLNLESSNEIPTIEQIIKANMNFRIISKTKYQPKLNQQKLQQVSRILKRISNFRGQNLINSFEIDLIIQKIEQIIIYIDLNQQIRDHNYDQQKVEQQLIKKSKIISKKLHLFQYKEYGNLIDNFDYLNQISNTINVLDIPELDKEQIKYCFDSIQNLCDFHINYFIGAKRILCFQNLRINDDVIMVVSRLQSKLNQLNHYQRQTLRNRQSFSKLSQYLNDFIQEENLDQFKYSFDFEQYLDKDKFLYMIKLLQKDIEQAIDNQEEFNDQICEQFISIRTYLTQTQAKLNEIVIPQQKKNEQQIMEIENQQDIIQTKSQIKMDRLEKVKDVIAKLIQIIDTNCKDFFNIQYSENTRPVLNDLVKQVNPLLQSNQDNGEKQKKKYIRFQYQFQSIKQQSDRQIYQSLITRYIKQLKIIKNLILIESSSSVIDSNKSQDKPLKELKNLIDSLSRLRIQVNNFDDLLENSSTDLNYYFKTHLDINNEDSIKPILLKIVKSICKNRNYEQIEIQYKASQQDSIKQNVQDQVDNFMSEFLVTISSTSKAIKIPTAYYIVMASQYQNTQSMATKIMTRLSVLETDQELIEIHKNSAQLKLKFAEYWKEEEQQVEQALLDSISKLKDLQFQISTTNSESEKQKFQQEYYLLEKEINQQITQIDDLQKNPNFQVQALFLTQIKSEITTLKDTLDKITQQLDFIMQDVAYLRGKSIDQLLLIRMNNVLQLKQINDIKNIFTPVKTKERNFVNKQDDPLTDLYEEIEEYFELDTMKTSMLIHGQAGSGKSTASRKIEELLWDKFNQVINDKKTQAIPVVPILIQLPQLKDPLNQAVEETLKSDSYRFNNKQINEFKEQVEQGKWRILFIFDSYDELKSQYLQTNILIKNRVSKWRKIGETLGFPKCITTSRTEIFISSDYHEWFWSETKSFNNFKEIQLSPFNKDAVRQYLDLYTVKKLRLILIKHFQSMYKVGDENLAIVKLKSFIQKLSSLIFQNQSPGNLITSNQANNIIQDLVNQYSTQEKQPNFDNYIEQMFVELTHIWNTQQYLYYINELKLLDILETPFIMELVVQVLPQIVEMSQNLRNLQQKFIHDYIRFKLLDDSIYADIQKYETTGQQNWNLLQKSENLFIQDQAQYDQQTLALEIKKIFPRQKGEVYEMIVKALSMQQINKFLFYEKFIDEYFEKQISKYRDLGETIDSEMFKKELWQCAIHIAQNMLREQITILDYQPQGFLEQGGLKKVSQNQSWKYKFFDDNDLSQQQMKKLIRACLPLKSRNQKYSFNHKSILEFLAAFDVIRLLDSLYSSYSQLQETVQDHFINSSNFSIDFMKGMVGFIIEQASKSTYIQTILTQIVLLSCQDENFITASSNAIFLLNQMQFQFCNIKYNLFQQKNVDSLKNLKVQDVNLEGINFYQCNLDNSRFVNVKIHNCNIYQCSFNGAEWTNIESDCLYEKTFDKKVNFFRFNSLPYIYDNKIIENQEQQIELEQPQENQEQKENNEQKENKDKDKIIKAQLLEHKYYKQLVTTKQIDSIKILEEDENKDIWVLIKKDLNLHVQKLNSNAYYAPLYCDKVFFPKAGSLFYYKQDLKLIIQHSYSEQKLGSTPNFMIILEDQHDVVDILHPFYDVVIIIQNDQQKTRVSIYRLYSNLLRYAKQLLVNGNLSDIRFFDSHLSMVVDNWSVKVIKINQIKLTEEIRLIQTNDFQIPQLFGIENEVYMNFISTNNKTNMDETKRINEDKQKLQNLRDTKDKKDQNQQNIQSDEQIQSQQNNFFSWQLVFGTQILPEYKNYFIKDNIFYLLAKQLIAFDIKNGKQLYVLNIGADQLSVHLIQDKLLIATIQSNVDMSVLRIFHPQPELLKQNQQKSVHAMSYDGLYLAYQINSALFLHTTKQFYKHPTTINLIEPAELIGFCKMNSSYFYTFFKKSKTLQVWNIHTLELFSSRIIKLEKFHQIFFIQENYFEFYDKTKRYSYKVEDPQNDPQIKEFEIDQGNMSISLTYKIVDDDIHFSIKKTTITEQMEVKTNKCFDKYNIELTTTLNKFQQTGSYKCPKKLINSDINQWYFFQKVDFFIFKEKQDQLVIKLMIDLYNQLELFKIFQLEDNQNQLFVHQQNDYFILINGSQIKILKYKKDQIPEQTAFNIAPRRVINSSVDKEYIYLFYQTFDFAIYKIVEVNNKLELINCYSTFKVINTQPLSWIK